MQKVIPLFLMLISLVSYSKNDTSSTFFEQQQKKILLLSNKLFHTKKITEEEKNSLNTEIISLFEETLNRQDSYNFNFDSLKKDFGILNSPDNVFRIIHWNVPLNDGTYKYYGFIQEKYIVSKKKIESILVYPLIDKSADIKNTENYISDNKKWYGMLYYKIIPVKTKSKTYYTLLGWDGNDKVSQKKFIDVLTFEYNGNPKFGADVFDIPKKNPKRISFEFASNCAFVLKYNESLNMITFDRLAPMEPQFEGQYQYYCTADFEYDGFKIKKGKWLFVENIAPKNDKTNSDNLYQNPKGGSKGKESDVMINKEKKKRK